MPTLTGTTLNFTTRTDLSNTTNTAPGQAAVLSEPGREGEFVFNDADLSTNVTSDTNQITFVPPSSDASGLHGAFVNDERFGIDFRRGRSAYVAKTPEQVFYATPQNPAALVDDTPTLKALIKEAVRNNREAAREVVIQGAGLIGIGSAISLPASGLRLICDGDARFVNKVSTGLFMYRPADPGDAEYQPLSADAPAYIDRVTVGSTAAANFSIKGFAFIRSQAFLPVINNTQNQKCGQIVRIRRIDTGGVLIFDRSLFYDFTMADSAEIAPLPRMGMRCEFENIAFGLQGTAPLAQRMFDLRWTDDYQFRGIRCENQRLVDGSSGESSVHGGIILANSTRPRVENFEFLSCGWYGVSTQGACQDAVIKDGAGQSCRHVVSLVYGPDGDYGEPANTLIEHVVGYNSDYAAIDTHETGFNTTIRNVTAYSSLSDVGVQIRNRNATLEDIRCFGNHYDGVNFEASAVGGTCRRLISYGNLRRGAASLAPDTIFEDIDIQDNGVGTGSGQCGILLAGGQIRGASFKNNISYAIYFMPTAPQTASLLIDNVYAEKNDRQLHFCFAGSAVNQDSLSFRRCEPRDHTHLLLKNGATSAFPPVNSQDTTWSTTTNPIPKRSGRATLSAGAATISTTGVNVYAGGSDLPPHRPRIALRFFDPNTSGETLTVTNVVNATSFSVASSNTSSSRDILWELLD